MLFKYIDNMIGDYGLKKLPSNLGYFTYNPNYRALLEVRTFDGILNDIIMRHKTFFNELGV